MLWSLSPLSQSLGSDGGVKKNASSSFGIPISKFGTWTHAESLSNQVQLLRRHQGYNLDGGLYGIFLGKTSGIITKRLGSKHGRNQSLSQSLGSDSGVKGKASSTFGIPSFPFSAWIHGESLSSQARTPRGMLMHTKTSSGGG
jgi:hypothetical protein